MTLTASERTGTELGRIDLHIPPDMRLDDDLLFAFCQANRELRIERNAQGDLEIMPPTGAETGAGNADLTSAQIADDALLPGLVLPLVRIWEPGF